FMRLGGRAKKPLPDRLRVYRHMYSATDSRRRLRLERNAHASHVLPSQACPSRHRGIAFSVRCLLSHFFHSKRLRLQGLTHEKSDLYLGVSGTAVGVATGQNMVPSTSRSSLGMVMWRALLFHDHYASKDTEEGEVQWQSCDGIPLCRRGRSNSRGALW